MIDRSLDITETRKPLQVSRRLLNGEALLAWAQSQGLPVTVRSDDFHVTVAYSRAPIEWTSMPPHLAPLDIRGGARTLKLLGPSRDALALSFASPDLEARWDAFRSAGATWNWPDYQPHITIAYDLADAGAADAAMRAAIPYAGPLLFAGEEFAPVRV